MSVATLSQQLTSSGCSCHISKPDYPTSTWEPTRTHAICCRLSISLGGLFFLYLSSSFPVIIKMSHLPFYYRTLSWINIHAAFSLHDNGWNVYLSPYLKIYWGAFHHPKLPEWWLHKKLRSWEAHRHLWICTWHNWNLVNFRYISVLDKPWF